MIKQKYAPLVAELMGTGALTLVVLVVSHMFGRGTAPWYTSLSAGAALALIVGTIGHISGAHVNPAVTLGLWTTKRIETLKALLYIASQLLGAVLALSIYNYATNNTLADSAVEFVWRSFWLEAFGSMIFGMGIMAAIMQKFEGFMKSYVIGMSLTAGALVASLASAGILNPAVAVGNSNITAVTTLAPVVGMVVGMNLYSWLFSPSEKSSSKKRK